MKYVSYSRNGRPGIGLLDVDSDTIQPLVWGAGSHNLLSVITGPSVPATDGDAEAKPLPLSDLRVLAPIPSPSRNIICVGKNYREHASEFARSGFDASSGATDNDAPAFPIFFTKAPSSVVGPGDDVEAHQNLTSALDYEAELAVIIGKGGRGILPEDAMAHVWGYTLINDLTARDLQQRHKQWFLGKSLDTFCPMGPWAVTADEVDVNDLTLECYVNDELRQKASTADLIFRIPDLIATLSAGITLQPGDLIATGTPAGVGIGFDPPRYLTRGDSVTVRANGLGELTNRIVASGATQSGE